jgi:hypothetical protein
MRNASRLSRLAAALTLSFLALLGLEHAIAPSLEPADHMISEYANAHGLAGVAGTVALFVWGASFAVTAAAAAVALGNDVLARALVGCLAVAAVGLTVAALCPTQAVGGHVPAGVDLELTGRLHDLASGAAQLAIFASVVLGARVVAARRFRTATVLVLVVAALVGLGVTALDSGARGLRQRGLIAVACAWELAFLAEVSRRAKP